MANSIQIGAVLGSLTALSGGSYGVLHRRGERPGLPGPQVEVVNLPGRDGGVAQVNGTVVRRMELGLTVLGSSRADVLSKVEAVLALLNPSLGAQYLLIDCESDRAWRGVVTGEVKKTSRGLNAFDLDVPWTCTDASAYATTETTQTVTINSNPKTANAPAAGVVAGSAYAYPTFVVKNTSGGTSSAITVENTTTGEKVSTSVGVANGTWLRFDAARQVIEQSSNSGASWTSFMAYRGSYRNVPRLKAGVANAIVVAGLSAGSLVITYRARYA